MCQHYYCGGLLIWSKRMTCIERKCGVFYIGSVVCFVNFFHIIVQFVVNLSYFCLSKFIYFAVVDCWFGASGWLAGRYKVVYFILRVLIVLFLLSYYAKSIIKLVVFFFFFFSLQLWYNILDIWNVLYYS